MEDYPWFLHEAIPTALSDFMIFTPCPPLFVDTGTRPMTVSQTEKKPEGYDGIVHDSIALLFKNVSKSSILCSIHYFSAIDLVVIVAIAQNILCSLCTILPTSRTRVVLMAKSRFSP